MFVVLIGVCYCKYPFCVLKPLTVISVSTIPIATYRRRHRPKREADVTHLRKQPYDIGSHFLCGIPGPDGGDFCYVLTSSEKL
jgi:hypothetical protein